MSAGGRLPAVLVVAGLDPSGGGGLLADAEAIRAAGARPLACAAAITVQTTRAVRGFSALNPDLVAAQVVALAEEEGPIGAVKLGMLGSAGVASALAGLRRHPGLREAVWVVNPVLRSSSGANLIEGGAAAYGPLLAAGAIFTPNLAEVAALTGSAAPQGPEEMEAAGRRLLEMGAQAALVKGGHLAGEPLDLLVSPAGVVALRGRRRQGTRRGTGCRLASFLAARLAVGDRLPDAARGAKDFVAAYLETPAAPFAPGPSSR